MPEPVAPKKVQFGRRKSRIEPLPPGVLKSPNDGSPNNETLDGSPPAYETGSKPRKSVKFTEDVVEKEHRKSFQSKHQTFILFTIQNFEFIK